MNRALSRLLCWFGLHDWDRVASPDGAQTFCRECGTTK